MCNLLLVVYAIGSISRFHCVAFFLFFVFVCMCVCVWATLPDLNKMDGWMEFIKQMATSRERYRITMCLPRTTNNSNNATHLIILIRAR